MSTSIALLWLSCLVLSGRALPRNELVLRQDAITLSNTSTCADLKAFQAQIGVTGPTQPMYDMLTPGYLLSEYFKQNLDNALNDFVASFAAPWGVGQSIVCPTIGSCGNRLNCDDLNPNDAPGSASAYAVLLSFQNFGIYINGLYNALVLGYLDWSALQIKFQQTYYPNPPNSDIVVKEFLNALSALVGVIGASSGLIGKVPAAVGGSAAALAAGVVGGINLKATTSDQSLPNLAAQEVAASVWYQETFNDLVYANDNLTSGAFWTGSWGSVSFADLIDHGTWLNYKDHPLENTDKREPRIAPDALKKAFTNGILGSVINYSWKQQGVFIVKYDVSEDDFNARGDDWTPGYGDFRFRTWYGGSAFFLQRIVEDHSGLFPAPYEAYPPGWGEVATDIAPCDTACIMQSAADGFHDGGFNYNISDTVESTPLTTDQSVANSTFYNIPRARGFFNIPVCDLTGHADVPDISTLNTYLMDQNAQIIGAQGSYIFCLCQGLTDMHGVSFRSVMPTGLVDQLNEIGDGRCYSPPF